MTRRADTCTTSYLDTATVAKVISLRSDKMYEENDLIKADPILVYDMNQRGQRVMKWRVNLLDPATRQAVDKRFYYQPPLNEIGLKVQELRPKYANQFRAGTEIAIWCEGEGAADAMNQALERQGLNATALGLHGQTVPEPSILETFSNVKTHVLFPDNDDPGINAMTNLERNLAAIHPQAEFCWVTHPEEAGEKFDAADYRWKSLELVKEALGNPTQQQDAEAIEIDAPAYQRKKPRPVEKEYYIGLIGDAVDRLDDHTEATREALHQTLLTGLCPLLGILPRIPQPLRATPNIFTVIVGKQFSGKKGTSWLDIEQNFLKPIAGQLNLSDDWMNARVTNVESGQGIINLIHHGDPNRLFVLQEFKSLFDAMTRDSSNVDSVLRQAFDRESLQVNRARDVQRVDDANISIIGHITPDELTEQVRSVWAVNGFFRRWLWCYSESSKEVNSIMPENIAADLVDLFVLAIENARRHASVTLTPEAWDYWAEWRRSLATDDESFITKASAGHESRVARMALVLALLDLDAQADLPDMDRTVGETLQQGPREHHYGEREIVGVKHLKTAIRWNQYSIDTLEYVFGNRRWDHTTQKIYDWLEEYGELELSQIYSQVFKGNKSKDEIRQSGEKLERAGAIRRVLRRKAGATKGRKAEVWILMSPTN